MYSEGSFAEGYAVGRDANGNNRDNGMFGDSAWWIIILLIFGWFGGWGNGGFGGNGGGNMTAGYDIGRLATTNDVASGFSTSAIMSNQNDLKLGQAGIQQTLCQGFSGINSAISSNGYETRSAINDLGYRLQQCCCETQRSIDNVNYNMAKNTCDIQQSINMSTRDIIDGQRESTNAILGFLTNEKISSLQAQNAALTAQLSQNAQTRTLIDTLRPTAVPAYITCSPYQSAYGFNGYNNCGCGCGCSV